MADTNNNSSGSTHLTFDEFMAQYWATDYRPEYTDEEYESMSDDQRLEAQHQAYNEFLIESNMDPELVRATLRALTGPYSMLSSDDDGRDRFLPLI